MDDGLLPPQQVEVSRPVNRDALLPPSRRRRCHNTQHLYSNEEPNGFEDLYRRVAVFHHCAGAEWGFCCSWSRGLIEDYIGYVHRPVPWVRVRRNGLGGGSAGSDCGVTWNGVRRSHVDGQRSASPGAPDRRWEWGQTPVPTVWQEVVSLDSVLLGVDSTVAGLFEGRSKGSPSVTQN